MTTTSGVSLAYKDSCFLLFNEAIAQINLGKIFTSFISGKSRLAIDTKPFPKLGFEPTNTGVKVLWLTACRQPNILKHGTYLERSLTDKLLCHPHVFPVFVESCGIHTWFQARTLIISRYIFLGV